MLEVARSLPAGAVHNETMAQFFIIKGQNNLFWGGGLKMSDKGAPSSVSLVHCNFQMDCLIKPAPWEWTIMTALVIRVNRRCGGNRSSAC